jgi:hypothetical protein
MVVGSSQRNIAETNDWEGDYCGNVNKPGEVLFTEPGPHSIAEHIVEMLWFLLVVE